MLLVQGRISKNYGFQMCLLAVLHVGSQGIVVKCTAAIVFLTVDRIRPMILNIPQMELQSAGYASL